jgi:hypothetical protein
MFAMFIDHVRRDDLREVMRIRARRRVPRSHR